MNVALTGKVARLRVWLVAARYLALPQVIIPCFLGALIAFTHAQFDILLFFICLIGLTAVGLGTYLLDDYFDLKLAGTHYREEIQREGSKVRTLKAPLVTDGTIKLEHVLYVGLGLFVIGALACAYLTIISGWLVLALSLAGVFICFFYSAPPIKLGYRGFGEISVALTTGPMICLGTYYVLTNDISLEPIMASLPIGILVGTILYIHSIMDSEPDKVVGKRTMAITLGSQEKAVRILPLPLSLSYLILILGVGLKILSPLLLIALLTIPISYKLVKLMLPLGQGDFRDIRRAWWMGPMEIYAGEPQTAWFMVRWYLARNLFIATTLLIFIGYIIAMLT
jgi:1,4-dihydroxy-2-naphthoate octaprenyltransferase